MSTTFPTIRDALQGNPPTADHQPDKRDLIQWGEQVEALIGLSGEGHYADTLSDLNAITGLTAGDVGFVLNDGTAVNNGVYKRGASTWSKTSELPASFSSTSEFKIITDLNVSEPMTFFANAGADNAPTAGDAYAGFASANASTGAMIAISIVGDQAYHRSKQSGTWQAWESLVKTGIFESRHADNIKAHTLLEAIAAASAGDPIARQYLFSSGVLTDFETPYGSFTNVNKTAIAEHNLALGYVTDLTGGGRNYQASDPKRGLYRDDLPGNVAGLRLQNDDFYTCDEGDFLLGLDSYTIFALLWYDGSTGGSQNALYYSSASSSWSTRLSLGRTIRSMGATTVGSAVRRADAGQLLYLPAHLSAGSNWTPASEWVLLELQVDFTTGEVRQWANGYNNVSGFKVFDDTGNGFSGDSALATLGAAPSLSFQGAVGFIAQIEGLPTARQRREIYAEAARRTGQTFDDHTQQYDPEGNLPGITFPWSTDTAIRLASGKYLVGGISRDGSIMAGEFDDTGTGVWEHKVLRPLFQIDDHNPPTFVQKADGHILAAHTWHGSDREFWIYKTTVSGDFASFDAGTDIADQIDPFLGDDTEFAYCQFMQTTDGNLHIVFRAGNFTTGGGFSGDKAEHWCLTTSTDGGTTWSTALPIHGPMRPYTLCRAVGNRIWFTSNDSHPAATTNGALGAENSVYCGYIESGNVYDYDGTLIGALSSGPYDLKTDFQRVYVGGQPQGQAWSYDIRVDGSGNVAIAFVVFPNATGSFTVHNYKRAYYNGTTWTVSDIIGDGRLVVVGGVEGTPSYSGGIVIDPEDLNTVYLSRNVGGKMQIERHVTADGGATWTATVMTSSSRSAIRPVIAGPKLFYSDTDYGSFYTDFGPSLIDLVDK